VNLCWLEGSGWGHGSLPARTVAGLRAMPAADELLAWLERVVEATSDIEVDRSGGIVPWPADQLVMIEVRPSPGTPR
jgi:hypothetical protein